MSVRIEELEKEVSDPNFWTNTQKSNPVIKELKRLKNQVDPYKALLEQQKELEELLSIVEDSEEDSLKHLTQEIEAFAQKTELLEFQRLLSDPLDINNAILSINAGAGIDA